ncbi:MAG: nucleotidyl transferase AbiEii/AbiGii toxin family protein [Candidatus Aureabacteria bacterium]|nr:nucleotidyl transferase AbiEii/AbiGii toxin family protein [Candidatus Auribacterota bacterium]
MDILIKHEMFEMEVLEKLNTSKMLEAVVFGGGTMLRLCHELNRYSVDLDFWITKNIMIKKYFDNLFEILKKEYEVTDAKIEYHTILFELRSQNYPKRLKIEIRKELKECDFQEMIAFSKYSNKQVILKTHTLEQAMKNKIAAFFDRNEIRDCFDIEFLLRRGIKLPLINKEEAGVLIKKLNRFKEVDFKVKLGSILESEMRKFYIKNKFSYLMGKLKEAEIKI